MKYPNFREFPGEKSQPCTYGFFLILCGINSADQCGYSADLLEIRTVLFPNNSRGLSNTVRISADLLPPWGGIARAHDPLQMAKIRTDPHSHFSLHPDAGFRAAGRFGRPER